MEIPGPPIITDEQLTSCRAAGDYRPVMFEWYKYVGLMCNYYASIRPDSPALRTISSIHYAIFVGLLNRCARLMFTNVALSHEGHFGETTAILDRCIFESAIKILWLCTETDEHRFTRFLADGLKTELEFKKRIEQNILNRAGNPLKIENRMLSSIGNFISSSELSEEEIGSVEKLPNLSAMINKISSDRLLYIVGQKIGSHHVHGTWPSLRLHYLEERDGTLGPRDHDCPTNVNQYVFIPLIVLKAMSAFISFVCEDNQDAEDLSEYLLMVEREIHQINVEVIGKDFELIKEI